ncbi:MAG: hypothetical protein R3F56_12755 [Planctomycetota bacterium]
MRPLLACVLASAVVRAQTSPALDALVAGDARRALDLLEAGGAPADGELRLRVIELLARVPDSDAALHERALGRAALMLPDGPAKDAPRLRELAAEVGRGLTRSLVAHEDIVVGGRVTDRTRLGAAMAAFQALRQGELQGSRDMLTLGLRLAPALVAGERPRDAAALAGEALAATPTPAQATELHGVLAQALLQLGRPEEALPHIQHVSQSSPTSAQVVVPMVRALPTSLAKEVMELLQPVVRSQPSQDARAAWIDGLDLYYQTVDRLADKRSTAGLVADLTTRISLPQTWHQMQWGEGFRVWMDPNARPSKVASGKDGLVLPRPQSAGWKRRTRPPEDLLRWHNTPYCIQRGEGPILVVYWFGPNLEYWYGDTPVERGVTAKTVRGHSAGAIARMVFEVAYGEDARRRQQRFKAHPAPPFALRERGQRRTFALGDVVYDETVFSFGQVTIEVLLRAAEDELAELEPELRWMFANLHKAD